MPMNRRAFITGVLGATAASMLAWAAHATDRSGALYAHGAAGEVWGFTSEAEGASGVFRPGGDTILGMSLEDSAPGALCRAETGVSGIPVGSPACL